MLFLEGKLTPRLMIDWQPPISSASTSEVGVSKDMLRIGETAKTEWACM